MEWYTIVCLVTLTDLQMRRAGLSASAEQLVISWAGNEHILNVMGGRPLG